MDKTIAEQFEEVVAALEAGDYDHSFICDVLNIFRKEAMYVSSPNLRENWTFKDGSSLQVTHLEKGIPRVTAYVEIF